MAKVTSGQITIIDQNDAKSVTSFIAPTVIQQTYASSEGTDSFIPNWDNDPQVVSANVFVGGSTENKAATNEVSQVIWTYGEPYKEGISLNKIIIIGGHKNPEFIYQEKVRLTDAVYCSSFEFVGNFLNVSSPMGTIYYNAVYTDPTTQLETPVLCSASVNLVVQGSNATFIQLSGNMDISVKGTAVDQNYAIVTAKLIKVGQGASQDTTCLYKWEQESIKVPGRWVPLYNNNGAQMVEEFKTRSVLGESGDPMDKDLDFDASTNTYTKKYITFYKDESAIINVPVNTEYSGGSENEIPMTIKIHEDAIDESGRFRVTIVDTTDPSEVETAPRYTYIFTVNDKNDPWGVDITSTGGTVFKNGIGFSNLIPYIRGNSGVLEDKKYKGFKFIWRALNQSGKQSAFVEMEGSGPKVRTGITNNTTNTITVQEASGINSGDYIKVYDSNSSNVITCEVESKSGNILTIKRNGAHDGFWTEDIPDGYINGYILKCRKGDKNASPYIDIGCKDDAAVITVPGDTNSSAENARLSITQYDVDVKGTITVDVFAPYFTDTPETVETV